MDTNGKAFLQYLAVKKDGTIIPSSVSLLVINRDGLKEATWDISYHWTNGYGRSLSGGVSHLAKYKFTEIYRRRLQGLA